ncbi:hypothetical protein N7466_002018 [Penicillium verhagenii]|uniref:uncharacterized protein n=1 Tax=Penicillium verhagenii TaxID=1562060 RepID=UPI002544F38C|nr:uncharacterized protein N7466_002018 [Penicillium verhagenii]KAJ5938884.1 hypothetical protein N7466_002018 [Penicillium verhagenii]
MKLTLLSITATAAIASGDVHLQSRSAAPVCSESASTLSLSDPPYTNYFYSDCNVAAQAVVTTPSSDSNLSTISPRLLIAWPAGNSGICAYFAPQNGVNGTLSLELVNSTIGQPLAPVYNASASASTYPNVGVQGIIRLNSSATLSLPILGSIRTIRDFVEGASIVYPSIQDAIEYTSNSDGSASLQRLWLDNLTTSSISFYPWANGTSANGDGNVTVSNRTLNFEAGEYLFTAEMNYPQLESLKPDAVLNSQSANLTTEMPDQTTALSFLSYSEKLLAGAWRFLTYFGRDSMISALLLEPVLSTGNGTAMEAVIGAVLERINRTDGSVCHEETIGDYATWTNLQDNITSTAMVDPDYYLPVLMQRYFLENPTGQARASAFFNTTAGSINAANQNLTWGQLALINAERIMRLTGPFAENQTKDNLIHLKDGQIVGQWRDSEFGIGGGRIPFDVNTALAPAALRSIAALSRKGIYKNKPQWGQLADKYAQIWEDQTLQFFEVTIPQSQAQTLVKSYTNASSFAGPDQSSSIDTDVSFYSISLDGYNNLSKVNVMHTDDCFRHYLLNTTNDTQLSSLLNSTATNIRRTFPAGLMTDVGMLVANPAFGEDAVYAQNWTTGAYHGTVVWSWPLAMMAKGLELQMGRCEVTVNSSTSTSVKKKAAVPDFCTDNSVFDNVKAAYNALWDSIELNDDQLSTEMWSWVYKDGAFQVTQLVDLPAPPGVGGQTESDIRQLWSLAFLAVSRNKNYQ